MIDYDKPDDDPIVAEVRRAREEYAAQFNFDLRLIFQDLRRSEKELLRDGHMVVPAPPHGVDPVKKVG